MSSLEPSAQAWLAADTDPDTKAQLRRILDEGDEKALEQGFSERMAFGTAGLRGLMGVGPANMNRLVIRQTSAGLADYLLQANAENAKNKGVVIAYDGRHMSREFAEDTAGVLAARGVKALLYDKLHPTPMGAFAVKYLGAVAGVVVTASHNPPQYNGYKVYQQGGNQINAPVDGRIAAAITRVADEDPSPKCLTLEEAQEAGKLQYLSTELFDAYRKQLFETVAHTDGPGKSALKIAYTPMHGVGAPFAEAIFQQAGFPHVYTVPEQREPDGDFPTVNFPNPEEPGAMDLVIALADAKGAQLAAANDPDADRMSCCARQKDGKMMQLTGDQVGSLLGYHILSTAPKGSWALNTVVSSRLLARIARYWGAQYQETLTGFKWLGAVAKDAEDRGDNFAFAYEEALGYMVSPQVWDKDGLSAIVTLAEFAAKLDVEGKTLWDQVETLHREFGISVTLPRTIRLAPGSKGGDLMVKLRKDLPKEIGGHRIILTSDLLDNPAQPADRKIIPKNDVLRFYFADEAYPDETSASTEDIALNAPRIIIRPSGTEPKVKIYTEKLDSLKEGEAYEAGVQRVTKDLENLVDAFFQFATNL